MQYFSYKLILPLFFELLESLIKYFLFFKISFFEFLYSFFDYFGTYFAKALLFVHSFKHRCSAEYWLPNINNFPVIINQR